MDWLDVILKALPDWLGDSLHSWADVLITATPDFGQVALPAMAVITGFFLIFMMEADA